MRPPPVTDAIVDLRGDVPATLPPGAMEARGLVLAESGLDGLPAWLGALTRLRMLDVAHNRLTALPDAIGALRALEVLYVGDNRLTALPEAIRPLAVLTYLGADANDLPT